MKILLYNIGYGTGLKGSLKDYFLKFWRYLWSSAETFKGIVEFFKRQNADIICLLEADVGSLRNRFRSQVKTIADKLVLPFYHHSLKYGPRSWVRFLPTFRKQHDAIISKIKGNIKRHYLKSGTKKLVLEFQVGKISIFTVHLGLLRSNLRRQQMRELTTILKKCGRPYLVCGDFNIFKGLSEVKDFIQNNKLRLIEAGATFPAFKPKRPLDLILACKTIPIKAAGVVQVSYSDHLPVWVEIDSTLNR